MVSVAIVTDVGLLYTYNVRYS